VGAIGDLGSGLRDSSSENRLYWSCLSMNLEPFFRISGERNAFGEVGARGAEEEEEEEDEEAAAAATEGVVEEEEEKEEEEGTAAAAGKSSLSSQLIVKGLPKKEVRLKRPLCDSWSNWARAGARRVSRKYFWDSGPSFGAGRLGTFCWLSQPVRKNLVE